MKNLLKGSQSETTEEIQKFKLPFQTACRRLTSGNASTVGNRTGIHV
jgi:hypothetical protein